MRRFLGVAAAGLVLALCLGNDSVSTSTPATSPAAVSLIANHCDGSFDDSILKGKHFDSAATARLNDNEGAMVAEKVVGLHVDMSCADDVTVPDTGASAMIAIYSGETPSGKQVLKVGQFDRPARTLRAAPTGDPIEHSYVYGRDVRPQRA